MARAAGKRTRAAARSHAKNLERPQNDTAGVPLADPHCANWRFQARLHGEPYVYPLDCDDAGWLDGFLWGAGHRLHRLPALRVWQP